MTRKRQGGYRTKTTKDRERKRLERNFADHGNVSEHPSTEPIPKCTAKPVSDHSSAELVSKCTAKPVSNAHSTSPTLDETTAPRTAAAVSSAPSQAINPLPPVSSALSYHPLALRHMVGDATTEITDDVIVAGLELIKANSDSESVEYYGYYKPAVIQFLTLNPCAHNSTLLPVYKDSLHIHPLTGHWVTSYFNSNTRQLFVYDSLQSTAHLQQVKVQLRQMYSNEIVDNIIYGRVTQQSTAPICGVMALAFAFSCFLGVNPINVNFDIGKAREHLKTCFGNGNISQFPLTLERNETRWILTYLENQKRMSSEHLRANVNKELTSSMVSPKILVDGRDKYKNTDSQKGKCYQTEPRKLLSPQQRQRNKAKDRYRKSEQRKLLSSAQRDIIKAKDKSHKGEQRKLLSPAQRETSKSRDKYRKGEQRKLLPPERRDTYKEKDKCYQREKRKLLSPERRDTHKEKDKCYQREKRKLLSPERRDTHKEKDKCYQREKRKLLSPERRDINKSKDKFRKGEHRKLLSPERREINKSKDKHRKGEQRKLLCPEGRDINKYKDKYRKSEHRKLLSPERREINKSKDKHRKGEHRKLLCPEGREINKSKDKHRKGEQRKLLCPEGREINKSKDKHRKVEQRKLLCPEGREINKSKDKHRKGEQRKLLSHKGRETYKEKDKCYKKEKRKLLSPEGREINKSKDKARKRTQRHPSNIETAIQMFKTNIKAAPEYVCTVCHRTLFRNSVNKFTQTTDLSATLSTHHISPDGCEYICCTCKIYISKNTIPPQAQVNNMFIPDTPDILNELTDFECRLLARRYPFMKIVQLPKGKQSGIIGRVVNVPVDASVLCSSLPRTLSNAGILPVKLKRKKTYKGHVFYQNIRPDKIKQAFQWLLKHNSHYQTVVESEQWENKCQEESEDVWQHFTDKSPTNEDTCDDNPHCNVQSTTSSSSESSDTETESLDDFNSQNIDDIEASQFDTCVQPADPAADASEIFSIAPGEGKHPLHIMLDPGCEEQAFPQLFPTGCFGFDADRQVKITPKKYFNARVLNRKEQSIDAGLIKDPDKLKSLILKDKAYNFLQTVRGSPPYWQKAMYKLMAAIKQFGIFTFFLTLSSADMKWLDTLNAILRQQGKRLSEEEIENLTWEERCALLRSNPVTTARHFDHRLQCFFNDLLLGPAQVLGKVLHYSYRIEFQQRGSPHAHCILWTDNAPKPTDPVENITLFIDKYISCAIPPEELNPDLYNLVTTVQKHHHTATCRKKGTDCRFHYPKMPSPYTLIASPVESDDDVFNTASLETAADILTHVMDTLQKDKEHKNESIHDLLTQSEISINQYIYALSITKRGKTVILKRQPQEIFINCYNSTLLLAWQANLDLQYCLDPYACIAYMVSYITKDEREMSTVLKNICKEMCHQDWREQLKSCANAFLNARELSAQEAVYRLLSLPLFKSNFVTLFVPTDFPHKRVAFLKPLSAVIGMDDEEENVFTTSVLDRYAARPKVLQEMCLAEFAVTYKVGKKSQDIGSDQEAEDEMTDIIQLNDNLGTMKKNSKKAVLRYHHKSQAKEPEEYYYSQLLLFLPWLNEEAELLSLPSYQAHYDENLGIVENNRSVLEHHADIISLAVEQFEANGPPVHAFDDIAPNTIQENDEDLNIEDDEMLAILNPDEIIPAQTPLSDIPVASSNTTSLEIRPGYWTEEDYFQHIRKLNAEQRDTFQTVYRWCHEKSISSKIDSNLEPLFLFVSGGAGTGKSHLISAIYQMALRHLQTEGENPDNVQVLLTAPTGTAAHNISGTTLHSAFLLPLGQTKSFMKLSDDKRNTLRSKLGNLELLIIDEISMVGCNLLLQLHYRLSEIRSTKKLFGGVSIIVFGDLYQLPPVRQKFIFKPVSDQIARLHGSLWEDFLLVELTRVMRQKEDFCFAEMLNRIRTASHTQDDLQVLQSRKLSQCEEHNQALHVFARNCDVDEYNIQQLNSLKHPIETLVAIDKKPKGLENYQPKNDSKFTSGLPSEVQLALGARVMLTRNIDIADGLVNGVQGQVVGFITSQRTTPPNKVAILVRFDSINIGQNTRHKSQFTLELRQHPDATPILRVEASFTVARKNANLKVNRYQFPLKLSWACTIHKVQGLTLDSIVVSFDHHFTSGQAYVALSRAKTLQGLHLLNFDERKLIANTDVQKEMRRLQEDKKCPAFYDFLIQWKTSVIVSVLNVRSYLRHRQDITNDPLFTSSDLIIFTETWLYEQNTNENIFPIGEYFCVRSDKPAIQQQSHAGGVAVLAKRSLFMQCNQLLCFKDQFLQISCVELTLTGNNSFFAIGVYNSPSFSNNPRACDAKLLRVIHHIKSLQDQCSIICTGDFNQNIGDNRHSHVMNTLTMEGFIQHVVTPTHVSGSCLDHFYTYNLELSQVKTVACYYSDHDWVTSQM